MEEIRWKETKFKKFEAIKTCPMCGGVSILETRSKTMIKGELKYVTYCRCVECDLRGPRVILGSDPHKARETAIFRWNRRVYED